MLRERLSRAGLSGDELVGAIANLDSQGLVAEDRAIDDVYKREFAWPAALAEKKGLATGGPRDLEAVVRALKPTVLIGTSGVPGCAHAPAPRRSW